MVGGDVCGGCMRRVTMEMIVGTSSGGSDWRQASSLVLQTSRPLGFLQESVNGERTQSGVNRAVFVTTGSSERKAGN